MSTPPLAPPIKPPWSRRLSHPSLPYPSLPTISGLRTALLGYLTEIESRLSGLPPTHDSTSSSSPFPSYPSSPSASSSSTSSTTALPPFPPPYQNLRSRLPHLPQLKPLDSTPSLILNQLSALKEDLTSYLPTLPQGLSREYLQSIPARLYALEHAQIAGMGVGVEESRKRVMEVVRGVLPSEDWGGWERLGWEDEVGDGIGEGDGGSEGGERERGRLGRVGKRGFRKVGDNTPLFGSGLEQGEDGEGEGEEPEYLFPNRTPNSAVVNTRRRAFRSTSLGSSSTHQHQYPHPLSNSHPLHIFPTLKRTRTAPLLSNNTNTVDGEKAQGNAEEGDEEEDDDDVLDILESPDLMDTELTKMVAVHGDGDLGPSVGEALERSGRGGSLIRYEDLPFVWRNNEHILSGYRFIPLDAKSGPIPLIKSAFSWHNETVNIHSHLIPTALISLLIIPLVIYASPLPNAHSLDTATLVLYFLSAVACLISSAGWHVLSGCAHRKWFEWGACVDYIGISWLIAASFGTVVYNAFYCAPKTVVLYCTVNLLCGALGSYLPFQKWFNERRHKNWRISFFLFLCVAMFAPMVQMFYQHGYQQAKAFVAPFGYSVLAYLVGLVFYAFHMPECFIPGRFDSWGASHQIWHGAIVMAIYLHYRAILQAHDARYEYSCSASDAGRPVAEVVEFWVLAGWEGLKEVFRR